MEMTNSGTILGYQWIQKNLMIAYLLYCNYCNKKIRQKY